MQKELKKLQESSYKKGKEMGFLLGLAVGLILLMIVISII